MAKKMVLEVVAGEEVGGWSEVGVLGLFPPNTVETRDRSTGALGMLLNRGHFYLFLFNYISFFFFS